VLCAGVTKRAAPAGQKPYPLILLSRFRFTDWREPHRRCRKLPQQDHTDRLKLIYQRFTTTRLPGTLSGTVEFRWWPITRPKREACNAPPLHDLSRDQTSASSVDEASSRRPHPENDLSVTACRRHSAEALLVRYQTAMGAAANRQKGAGCVIRLQNGRGRLTMSSRFRANDGGIDAFRIFDHFFGGYFDRPFGLWPVAWLPRPDGCGHWRGGWRSSGCAGRKSAARCGSWCSSRCCGGRPDHAESGQCGPCPLQLA
jgi:hypothetical protein